MLFANGGLMAHLSDKDFWDQTDKQIAYENEHNDPEPKGEHKKPKLSKKVLEKIDRLSLMDMEDIAEQSVMEATRRLRVKERKAQEPQTNADYKPMGYWQPRRTTTHIYAYTLDGRLYFCIKGGKHELLKYELNGKDKQEASIKLNLMLGNRIHKDKKGRYTVYINKR